jgi:hypothetical protein
MSTIFVLVPCKKLYTVFYCSFKLVKNKFALGIRTLSENNHAFPTDFPIREVPG